MSHAAPGPTIDLQTLRHEAILASAGSGKTHALSGRYLTLLAAGASAPTILASTFTRAAAGEIRDRLLSRLASAVDDENDRRELQQQIGAMTLTRAQVVGLLAHIARHLHVLQVRTLDAFFASVAMAFGPELGLPGEATVIDEIDDTAMRHEAMRLMLDERDPQPLIEQLRLLTRGESHRGVMAIIDCTVADLYQMFLEADAGAWECVEPIGGLLAPSQLQGAIDALVALPANVDRRVAEAHRDAIEAAMAHNWAQFIGKGIAAKIADGERTYHSKAIPHEVLKAYELLVSHAAADLVDRLRQQTLATRDLLQRFHEHYRALKRRRRVLTFGDLTHAMSDLARRGEAEDVLADIGFRLDGRIAHLLLDEFQDTSHAQWRALAPMALEITANAPPDRTFFCVGDVKQSIYGWRGASPEILERLPHLLQGVHTRSLDVSWRSSPIVIGAVNEVFGSLAQNAALLGDEAHRQAASAWAALFQAHSWAKKLDNAPGRVELRFAQHRPAKGDERYTHRERLRLAARLVSDLHVRHRGMSIGVLTRSNAAVARLLYELGPARQGLAASGRGGGPLIDAPPVNAILDLLRMADHPDDTIAAFNVANSPLGAAISFTDGENASARRTASRHVRERLMLEGYQAMIAHWVALIACKVDARELRRLTQLVELAGAFDRQEPGLRTGGFIALVEAKDVADAQPAPIEVMTIHQAKGLEFDAVVLPDLQGPLAGRGTPPMIFERDERSGMITRICRYAKKSLRNHVRKPDDLEALVQQQQIRAIREGLSTLYVALTRARHGLYMLVDPPRAGEESLPKTAAGVLRAALAPTAHEPGALVHEAGDANWMGYIQATVVSQPGVDRPTPERIPLATSSAAPARASAAKSASAFAERAMAHKSASLLRANLQLTDPEGRERGTVIHALFEQIAWLEDFNADDAALLSITLPRAPRRDLRWHHRQIAAFRSMLAKPGIAGALSRGAIDPTSVILHRELPFVRTLDAGVQTGAIDRLVLRRDASTLWGRIVGATIIDFKTDAIAAGSLRAQAETHRAQLQTYREVAAEMFALDQKAIAMQVLLVGAGAAVTL